MPVWKKDGEELLVLRSVQEMILQVNGGRSHKLTGEEGIVAGWGRCGHEDTV